MLAASLMVSRIVLYTVVLFMYISSEAVPQSRLNETCKKQGLQGRLVWFDADANLRHLSTRQGVAFTVGRCKAANINTIIVDVKPLSGYVLYNSKIAPKLAACEGFAYPAGYDLLKTVIEEAHKAGIKVHAAVNVFSEGSHKTPGGPAFKHKDWQCVQYDVDRYLAQDDGGPMKITCAGIDYKEGEICLYGDNPEAAGSLPENTVYVRVTADGVPLQHGTATGRPVLKAPEGGYLIVASGEKGEWLKQRAETRKPFEFTGKGALKSVVDLDTVHHAVFVNPANPQVRNYELSIIKEICSRYDVDGVVMDRMRYPNIYADFSDVSRLEFEKHLGRKMEKWPDDVFSRSPVPGNDIIRGPLFKEWLKFRAGVIKSFLADVRNTVKSAKPGAKLGVYVGSWYPAYFDVGVNWGSSINRCDYEWWPDGYEETGYAGLADYICTGCYYMYAKRDQAAAAGEEEWKSVEAAAEESIKAIRDETYVYGSLYLRQYNSRPDRFTEAINECLHNTQGCMLFDLVYLREYNWWPILENTFISPARAPHDADCLKKDH